MTTLVMTQQSPVRQPTLRLRPVSRQRPVTAQKPMLSEELFAGALSREFKRVDRFDESFALLIISRSGDGGAGAWADVVAALSDSRAETDIMGWFEAEASIGIIRPLVHLEPGEAASSLGATVQAELARVLSPDNVMSCSIRLEVFSPTSHAVTTVNLRKQSVAERLTVALKRGAKRTLDIIGSLALLVALAPVFAVVAALVKLTSNGPVFFRQGRIGQNGKPFTMLKFRTMHVNADPTIHQQYVTQFIQSGEAAGVGPNKVFKIVDDPRVTPIGRFLRRSSLDELPQFLNVLRGEMSLVGPRPPLPYEVARYKRWHRRRLTEAKPGITGLWQVEGRSRTTFDEMVRLDLRYARQHSLMTDVRILLATPRAVVTGKGAH